MKLWKKKNPNSESVHVHSSAVTDGGGNPAGEERQKKLEQSSTFEAAEQVLEDEEVEDQNSESEKEYEQVEIETENQEGGRKNLAEGFYEIEAVRRKRIRKGQAQYLIKWRGWPEAANTWEPVKNFVQCSDVIDAFEESLKSRKSRLIRKRKPKISMPQILLKKKQQKQQHISPEGDTYNASLNVARTAEDHIPFPRLNDSTCTNINKETYINSATKVCENGDSVTRVEEMQMQSELNVKLCELKGAAPISLEDADRIAITTQDQPTGVDPISLGNGLLEANRVDPIQSGPCTGAKRRKSGSVKRFKKDPDLCSVDDAHVALASCAALVSTGYQNLEGNNTKYTNKCDESGGMLAVTQIVKAINYKASTANNVQEIFVAFEAVRSDGTEVIVDNKFMKTHNPLLLLDFYEKHLRCDPTLL